MYVVILLEIIDQKIFDSTLSNDIGRNVEMPLEFSSFGTKIPSARPHDDGMVFFFHRTLCNLHNLALNKGQFLYTLYVVAVGPGADDDLPFLTTELNSDFEILDMSKGSSGNSSSFIPSKLPRGVSLWESL